MNNLFLCCFLRRIDVFVPENDNDTIYTITGLNGKTKHVISASTNTKYIGVPTLNLTITTGDGSKENLNLNKVWYYFQEHLL